MSTPETAIVIVDSSSFDFSYQGDWKNHVGQDTTWALSYLNTSRDAGDRLGNFTFSFEGFDATFVGGAPMPPTYSTYPPSWLTVDPDSPDAIAIPVPASENPPYYFSWYKTPSLRYGNHRVLVTHCVQTVMDYALVTVGPETTLAGRKLFVDDSDSQILYSGSGWKRNNDVTPGYLIYKAMPAYNTSNEATQSGDSFTFSFLGTSVSVYGLFSWQNLSSLILQYELDGDVTSASYPIRPSTVGIHPVQINFPFLLYDHLSPDTHQLKVTVKEISNTTFRFDYITYTPAFTTLASRSTSDNRTVVVAPPPSQNNDDLEVKIIIGSIIGGLALLAISVASLVWWNRRLNARSDTSPRRGSDGVRADGRADGQAGETVSEHIPSPPAEFASLPISNATHTEISTTVTPYPHEKVPDFASSPSSQPSFSYLGALPPTTVSAYPVEKLPDISSVIGASTDGIRATGRAAGSNTRAFSITTSSSSTATRAVNSLHVSSPTLSSATLPDTGVEDGYLEDPKLLTIHETRVRPPSYATLSASPPGD